LYNKWLSVLLIVCFVLFDLSCSTGKPDPPRNLSTAEVTESSVGLRWETPELDGGSPITGYVIEMRNASKMTWNKVDTTSSLEFNVTGLAEGTEYVFHVATQNAVGISEFVELQKGVTPKGKFGKIQKTEHCWSFYIAKLVSLRLVCVYLVLLKKI
jgi:Fibronectin type III domain